MCNRLYYFQKNLNNHITAYHEGKRFDCNYENCEERFCSRASKRRHMQLMHAKPEDRKKPSSEKKRKPRRKPRKDIGLSKPSNLATQLSGYQACSDNEQLANALSSETCEESTGIVTSDDDLVRVPELLIPLRQIIEESEQDEEESEIDTKADTNESVVIKDKLTEQKSFDFSTFLV